MVPNPNLFITPTLICKLPSVLLRNFVPQVVQFLPFGPLTFLKTVQFHPFRPSTIISWDRPVSFLWIVQFYLFTSSSFPPLDQSFPIFALLTVHYRISGPSTFAATFSDNASSLSRSSLALVWHASSLSHFTYVSLSRHWFVTGSSKWVCPVTSLSQVSQNEFATSLVCHTFMKVSLSRL